MARRLTPHERADLFEQLAQMEEAGLPPDKAFGLLETSPGEVRARATSTLRLVRTGTEIASAGERAQLFDRLDANLVRVASASGTTAKIYRRLADHYARKAMLQGKVRAKLMLPAAIFAAAVLLAPVPGLAQGSVSAGQFLLHVLMMFVAAWLVCRVVMSPPQLLLRVIPLVAAFRERSQLCAFFETLALMLEAGLPMMDALPRAITAVGERGAQTKLRPLERRVRSGETLTQAIGALPEGWRLRVEPFITSGEASGRLPESIFKYADMENEELARLQMELAAWLPRIAYLAAALYAAASILGSGAFMPRGDGL